MFFTATSQTYLPKEKLRNTEAVSVDG